MQQLYAHRMMHDTAYICREDDFFWLVYKDLLLGCFITPEKAAAELTRPVTLILLQPFGEIDNDGRDIPSDLTGWQKLV